MSNCSDGLLVHCHVKDCHIMAMSATTFRTNSGAVARRRRFVGLFWALGGKVVSFATNVTRFLQSGTCVSPIPIRDLYPRSLCFYLHPHPYFLRHWLYHASSDIKTTLHQDSSVLRSHINSGVMAYKLNLLATVMALRTAVNKAFGSLVKVIYDFVMESPTSSAFLSMCPTIMLGVSNSPSIYLSWL